MRTQVRHCLSLLLIPLFGAVRRWRLRRQVRESTSGSQCSELLDIVSPAHIIDAWDFLQSRVLAASSWNVRVLVRKRNFTFKVERFCGNVEVGWILVIRFAVDALTNSLNRNISKCVLLLKNKK